jgi:hypothetical protein
MLHFTERAMPKVVYEQWTFEKDTSPSYDEIVAAVEVIEVLCRIFLKELLKSAKSPKALLSGLREVVREYARSGSKLKSTK